MSITLSLLSVIDLLLAALRVEVARLRELELSHRFRGDMERASREGNRESSEGSREVLRRPESRPLAKLGNPTLRSNPDIIADFGRFPVAGLSWGCAVDVGTREEDGEEGLLVVTTAPLRAS